VHPATRPRRGHRRGRPGKAVALRAAVHALDPSRHVLIYLPNPSVGVRSIHHTIVAALGGVPRTHHATLVPQALDAIANEQAERGRTPILAIDEAHELTPPQLEAVRMLTNHDLAFDNMGVSGRSKRRNASFGDVDS
jgi:type II secretory pathway predicted ATPase ExeA